MKKFREILSDTFFAFILLVLLSGCCDCRKCADKSNDSDTIISICNMTVIHKNDTALILCANTANAKCKPLPKIRNINENKNVISRNCDAILKNRFEQIKIANYVLSLNKDKTSDSLIVYEKEYVCLVNYDVVRSLKMKRNVTTLDFRDRKMFYSIMNYYEGYLGRADEYSIKHLSKNVDREIAQCVSWKVNNMEIVMENHKETDCLSKDEQRNTLSLRIMRIH